MPATIMSGNVMVSENDVVRFGTLRFWAARGFIHIEDSKDNSYEQLSVRTALTRMKAISEMLGNNSSRQMYSEDQFDRMNRERHAKMLEGLTQLIYKARVQGEPGDKSAIRDLLIRRKRTYIVPGNMSAKAAM